MWVLLDADEADATELAIGWCWGWVLLDAGEADAAEAAEAAGATSVALSITC